MFQDRVVPQEAITATEKENTLQRLNQVIQHRLVTGNLLPQMRNVKVRRNILPERSMKTEGLSYVVIVLYFCSD